MLLWLMVSLPPEPESIVETTEYAAMAQVAEHILGKDEVTSSNLVSSSKIKNFPLWEVFYFCCSDRFEPKRPVY